MGWGSITAKIMEFQGLTKGESGLFRATLEGQAGVFFPQIKPTYKPLWELVKLKWAM